jgi:hypothetical protein
MSGEYGRVRVSSAEREAVLAELGRQFSEGRLRADEFAERTDAIIAALTRDDLFPIFADLPVVLTMVLQGADPSVLAAQAARDAQRTRTNRNRLLARLFGILRAVSRVAAWASAMMIVLSSVYYLFSGDGNFAKAASPGSSHWLILSGYGWLITTALFITACMTFTVLERRVRIDR